MNKTTKLVWGISIALLCLLGFILYKVNTKQPVKHNNTNDSTSVFSEDKDSAFFDGLKDPVSETSYQLDEYEPGISKKSVYMVDINNDNKPDRITKSFFENWNAHSYYEYKVELNKNGKYVDITPKGLRTNSGADCDLQQVQFVFKPKFRIVMIYRALGTTWKEPTMAKKRTYRLSDDKLNAEDDKPLRFVCDVKELF